MKGFTVCPFECCVLLCICSKTLDLLQKNTDILLFSINVKNIPDIDETINKSISKAA